jgi:hypothetical protein
MVHYCGKINTLGTSNTDMAVLVLDAGDRKLSVWLSTTQDPSQEAWDQALELIRKATAGVDVSKIASLVITDGGAPNAVQRKQLNDMFGGPIQSAAVTVALTNPVKRGVATALLWLNPSFRAFQPSDFDRALQHLGLESAKSTILGSLKQLQQQLPPNATLKVIGETSA